MRDHEARRQAIVAAWGAAWDKGEVDALDQLLAPAYQRVTSGTAEAQDRDALKAMILTTRSAFPDLVTTVDDVVVEGDLAAIRWHSAGTHTHGFLGVPPTRKTVIVSGATFARFEDGLVVEEHVTWDPRALLAALGIIHVGEDN
jgi:steroid delta-isomerase-like uncharacterized protein